MTSYIEKFFAGYSLGLCCDLSPASIQHILDLVKQPVSTPRTMLGGRARAVSGEVSGIGRVVIKHYFRGGFLGRFVGRRYVRWGAPRSQSEFLLLQLAQSIGVTVPEPIAFISQGRIFYRAWLVTREIEGERSLAQLSIDDEESVRDYMDQVVRQVSLLIDHGILHVDLHPGNVLIDAQGKVFLLDFDKARQVSMDRSLLRDRYICRWRRAVIKHGLPEVLSELLCLGLRRSQMDVAAVC